MASNEMLAKLVSVVEALAEKVASLDERLRRKEGEWVVYASLDSDGRPTLASYIHRDFWAAEAAKNRDLRLVAEFVDLKAADFMARNYVSMQPGQE